MRPRQLLAALLAVALSAPQAFGWWETGHRTVARAAVPLLTEAARTRLALILHVSNDPALIADALADASIWPDQTKSQTHTAAWHFIDVPLEDTRADLPSRCGPDDNCLTARIRLFSAALKARPADGQSSDLDAVRYLVHFMGDLHQPLHDATDADDGGNCERLAAPVDEAKNVHALWDGGIVRAMDTSEARLTAQLSAQINHMSRRAKRKIAAGSVDDWAWESHEIAVKDIYGKLHIPVEPPLFPHGCSEAPAEIRSFTPQIDSLYIDSMQPVVRKQLLRASIRLAEVLNTVL